MPQQPYDYGRRQITVPDDAQSSGTIVDLLQMAQIDAERMIELHNIDENAHPGLIVGDIVIDGGTPSSHDTGTIDGGAP